LSELEEKLNHVRSDRHTVFYCAGGLRAVRAAAITAEALRLSGLYYLDGGLAGWDGETIPDMPRLQVFDTVGSVANVVLRAMDLEKGAVRLYKALLARFAGTAVESTLRKLHAAEEAHARLLHATLTELTGAVPEEFDAAFASMKGDCLESGETYDEALSRIGAVPPDKSWVLLELALEMELSAYDLYKNLAVRHHRRALEDVLLNLATQEKLHYQWVLEAIGKAAAQTNVQT
jgi:rubrerythrin